MKSDATESALTETPTRVRYGVLGFACSLSMITYLDRVCFGAAAPNMVADLGLESVADLQWAMMAFAFAYAAFEVPSGWLGDVYGPRRTLIRIVLWWSLFTALTGLVGLSFGPLFLGLGFLTTVRFLFGMGEAGAYPNITRALHNWFPSEKRGFAQGMVWMSGRLMGGLTPLVLGLLVAGITFTEQVDGQAVARQISKPLVEWRTAFWIFGALGLLWTAAFAIWFRNRPEEKPGVNAAEIELIRAGDTHAHAAHTGVPWGFFLRSGNLWLLCAMYFCAAYGWYFHITYLPDFLQTMYGVAPTSIVGWMYKGGPLWLGAVGCLLGGALTDTIIRRTGNRRFGRRIMGVTGHSLCALCYLSLPWMPDAFTFFLASSLGAFFNDLTMGSAWATCQDIGRRYAAIVAGCMNTIGNLGGMLAGYLTGVLLKHQLNSKVQELGVAAVKDLSDSEKFPALFAGYQIAFLTFAAAYAIAVICWFRIDSTKPVVPDTVS